LKQLDDEILVAGVLNHLVSEEAAWHVRNNTPPPPMEEAGKRSVVAHPHYWQ